jgi:hypothetical protein
MGGGGKAKAPPAPDYTALMQQQQAQYQQNYQQQLSDMKTQLATATQANRATQVGPGGTLSWSQDPSGQWTQTTTLSPQEQQIYNTQLANQQQAQGVQSSANTQLQNLMKQGAWQPTTALPQFSQDYANNYANEMEKTLTARLQPQYTQDQNAMQTKLSLQGLQPGTEAYDRAYQNLLKSQGDVISQANLQAQLAGQNQAQSMYGTQLQGAEAANTLSLQQYMTPWDTATKAAGLAGGASAPSFANYNQQGTSASLPGLGSTDIVGAAQQQYAQQMQNYNQQQQASSGKSQGIGSMVGTVAGGVLGSMAMPGLGTMAGASLGSSLGGAAGGMLSDIRLKENVESMDDEEAFEKLLDIVPITWNWKGLKFADSGVAAQQIAERMPELINKTDGYMTVNYTGLFALLQGAFRHLAKELNHG